MTNLLLILLLTISCDSNDAVQSYRISKNPTEVKNIQSDRSSENNLKWDTPKGWIVSSGSKMRLASYNVPYSDGYGDLSIMILSGNGGGVEANINRWRQQIDLEPHNISDINKTAEKRENNLGTYQIFEIVNTKSKNKAFLSAIMPNSKGTVFIKLSISKAGISEIKDDFIYFCDSFKLVDE